jgi:hypothetical protein
MILLNLMGITYCNSNSILIHERTPYISSFGRFGKFAAGRSTEWGGGTKLKYKIYKAVTKGGVEMSTSLIKVMAVVKNEDQSKPAVFGYV